MNIKIKVLPKYAYLISSAIVFIFFCFFAYKAFVAYLIHKELYGDGMDVLVSLRAALSGIMFLITMKKQITLALWIKICQVLVISGLRI